MTYVPLTLVPIIIFFLTMIPTHRVLADTKFRELETVNAQIYRAGQAMLQRLEEGQGTGDLAHEISALVAYERRLHEAKTWPYDTAMLRTLFISVLAPIVATLTRFFAEQLVR